ncbi:MAG TPA: hypothetical protein VM032_15795 [Vicinamibacterales bacterium]|nr:hypothetical protein [Vicinamibacterales bacterium]
MAKPIRLFAAALLTASMAACSGVSSPSTQATEEFSDTLAPLGQVSKPFSVSKTGEMQLTLKSLTPRPVVGFIALAIGVPNGSACSPIPGYVVSQAAVGQQYAFPQITKGAYCLLVADANGALTASATFTVSLSHP